MTTYNAHTMTGLLNNYGCVALLVNINRMQCRDCRL